MLHQRKRRNGKIAERKLFAFHLKRGINSWRGSSRFQFFLRFRTFFIFDSNIKNNRKSGVHHFHCALHSAHSGRPAEQQDTSNFANLLSTNSKLTQFTHHCRLHRGSTDCAALVAHKEYLTHSLVRQPSSHPTTSRKRMKTKRDKTRQDKKITHDKQTEQTVCFRGWLDK